MRWYDCVSLSIRKTLSLVCCASINQIGFSDVGSELGGYDVSMRHTSHECFLSRCRVTHVIYHVTWHQVAVDCRLTARLSDDECNNLRMDDRRRRIALICWCRTFVSYRFMFLMYSFLAFYVYCLCVLCVCFMGLVPGSNKWLIDISCHIWTEIRQSVALKLHFLRFVVDLLYNIFTTNWWCTANPQLLQHMSTNIKSCTTNPQILTCQDSVQLVTVVRLTVQQVRNKSK